MTSGGNYPPDPYPGSYGYPPEGDDSSEQRRRDDHPAYGPDPSERDAEASSPRVRLTSVSSGAGRGPGGDQHARSPGRTAGRRPSSPNQLRAGQVYGRPSPTTYGRPVSPAPVADPAIAAAHRISRHPPGRLSDAGRPATGVQPSTRATSTSRTTSRVRPAAAVPAVRTGGSALDSDGRRGARAAVPGQFDVQREDSWDEREDPPSRHERRRAVVGAKRRSAVAATDSDPPSWEQGARGAVVATDTTTVVATTRRPGVRPNALPASTDMPPRHRRRHRSRSTAARHPFRRHRRPMRLWPWASLDQPTPTAAAGSGPRREQQRPSGGTAAAADAAATATRPTCRAPMARSANAFGPGVYGAGVYGAATYGTPRDRRQS